jgi:hypothetical protein
MHIIPSVAWHGDSPSLDRMLVLPMATVRAHVSPPVILAPRSAQHYRRSSRPVTPVAGVSPVPPQSLPNLHRVKGSASMVFERYEPDRRSNCPQLPRTRRWHWVRFFKSRIRPHCPGARCVNRPRRQQGRQQANRHDLYAHA